MKVMEDRMENGDPADVQELWAGEGEGDGVEDVFRALRTSVVFKRLL